jgi:hypothetical protein|tara:strand:+ start:1448 stop:3337 length:1890 start_codon:yes stop_codon:yes gene_type:complete
LSYKLLKLNSGIVKDITEYSAGKNGPFYVDSNLVRFKNGYPSKIGGWQQEEYYDTAETSSLTLAQGKPKNAVFWRASDDGIDRIALGTHNHLYIINSGVLYDITPLRKTSTNLSNPLVTTNGSTTITITDNSHGAINGDFIVIEQATAVGGVSADTINRVDGYSITFIDSNSYSIQSPTQATSGATGGGTGVDIKYLIGRADFMNIESSDTATGWGVGTWNLSTWGTARNITSDTVALEATQWSLQLWGEDLLASNRDGQIYYWDTSAGEVNRASLASALGGSSGIPTKNKTMTISFPDRHLIVGGTTTLGTTDLDPMLVRFSDQEDFTNFTPTATNTSGDQRLEIGNKIVSIIPTKNETFISTDEAVYGMSFVGPPFTFSFRLLGVNCGAIAKNGSISVDGNVYWLGKSNFFVYNGAVQELPCTVKYYLFDRIQQRYFDKTFVGQNKKFNEITWFYVSVDNPLGTVNPEPDSYITYNYAENTWVVGTLDRNVWLDAQGFKNTPFAFDADARLYNHESGNSANGDAMNCFIESGELEIDETGNRTFLIDKIVPDATLTTDTNLFIEFKCKKYPNGNEITKGPFTVTSSTQKLSTRAKGRQIAIKYSSTGTNDEWSLGDFRINTTEDSFR